MASLLQKDWNEALLGSAFMTSSAFLTEQFLSKIPKGNLDHLAPSFSI